MKNTDLYAWEQKQYKLCQKNSKKYAKMMIKDDYDKALLGNIIIYTTAGVIILGSILANFLLKKINPLWPSIYSTTLIGLSIVIGPHIIKKIKKNNIKIIKCKVREKKYYNSNMKFYQI